MKSPIIYSCLTNNHSKIRDASKELLTKFDFILFSDQKIVAKGWKVIRISKNNNISPRRKAKMPKIQPWNFFESDYSVWIDANMELHVDNFIKNFENFKSSKKSIGIFEHPKRRNILEEISEVKKRLKDDPILLDSQKNEYETRYGDLTKTSLYQGGFIMRDHSDLKLRLAMKEWQDEIDKFSARDQISLPIALRNLPREKIFLIKKDQFKNTVKINSHRKYTSEHKPRNFYEKVIINLNKIIYFILTNTTAIKIKKILKR